MVCVPCIVIPLLLWVWHKFIQPWFIKFWNPSAEKSISDSSGPPQGVEADNKEFLYIQKQVQDNPVMLFSKTTCSYCKMAKDLLDKLEVNYSVDEIGDRADCAAIQDMFQKMTGQRTVPRVFIGGKCVGGGSDLWTLHNNNKLEPMLRDSGATFRDKKAD